jgi:hypothetical protein
MIEKKLLIYEISALKCLLFNNINNINDVDFNDDNFNLSNRIISDDGGYTYFIIQSSLIIGALNSINEYPIGCTFSHPRIINGGGALLWYNKDNCTITIEFYVYVSQNWMKEALNQPLSFKWDPD